MSYIELNIMILRYIKRSLNFEAFFHSWNYPANIYQKKRNEMCKIVNEAIAKGLKNIDLSH